MAAAFAVWTGLMEEIPVFVAPLGGVVVRLSEQFLWMTPLGNLFFFGLAGLGLILVGRLWSPATSRPVVAGAFSGLSALALGLFLERLHPVAVLLLAVGVGTQVRRMTRGPVRRRRLLPALALGGVLVVLGLMARSEWKRGVWESTWLNWLPAPPPDAPNILLVILDTVRGASLGFMDDLGPMSEWPPVATPALDALAERSVVFTRAMVPSPWTLPSHASMFTGRWPHELAGPNRLGAEWAQSLDPRYPTLAETLARNGYLTAGFVGNLVFTSAETGLVRGFLTYEDYTLSLQQTLLSCALGRRLSSSDVLRRVLGSHDVLNRKSAETVADQFLAWHARGVRRPFFAFLNFFDAHEPYPVPDSVKTALPPGSEWNDFSHFVGLLTGATAWRNDKWTMDPEERKAHATGYHEGILLADRALGRVLAEMERRGALENTIVIVASDHGEQLGEHGLYNHNNSLYLPLLHVPLLVLDPREEPAVRRVGEVVTLKDMAATVLDLAGVDAQAAGIGGRSLAPFWRGGGDPGTVFAVLDRGGEQPAWYPVEWGPSIYSLTDSAYHYLFNGDGTEELYDFRSDPGELKNLAGSQDARPVLGRFRTTLSTMVSGLPPVQEEGVEHPRAPAPVGWPGR